MDIKELFDILSTDKPSTLIKEKEDSIFDMIPELRICKGFDQNNEWHIYDVYEHILHVVDGVENNIILRLTALFHDVGKPLTYIEDELGVGHFYGHWDKSKEIFDRFIKKYDVDDNIKEMVSNLILYHDINIDKISSNDLENLIFILGEEGIILLFKIKRSDLLAQNPKYHDTMKLYDEQENRLLKVVKENGKDI